MERSTVYITSVVKEVVSTAIDTFAFNVLAGVIATAIVGLIKFIYYKCKNDRQS